MQPHWELKTNIYSDQTKTEQSWSVGRQCVHIQSEPFRLCFISLFSSFPFEQRQRCLVCSFQKTSATWKSAWLPLESHGVHAYAALKNPKQQSYKCHFSTSCFSRTVQKDDYTMWRCLSGPFVQISSMLVGTYCVYCLVKVGMQLVRTVVKWCYSGVIVWVRATSGTQTCRGPVIYWFFILFIISTFFVCDCVIKYYISYEP